MQVQDLEIERIFLFLLINLADFIVLLGMYCYLRLGSNYSVYFLRLKSAIVIT